MIWLKLFAAFLQVGAFAVGGGYASIPLIQAQAVERYGWLTMSEFTDLVTIAEMTPGPIAVNAATFVGIRVAGVPGSVAATLGCIFPSMIIVSLLALIYFRYRSLGWLQSVLASLRCAVVALIASAGLRILRLVAFGGNAIAWGNVRWFDVALFAGAFFVLRRFKWNPIRVMALCGAACLLFGIIAR